jgi:hypothetical protein
MSDKLDCPGCNSYTSGVLRAVADGEACPYCGLPAETVLAVNAVRRSRADAELIAKLEAATIRAGRAEAELGRLREALAVLREPMLELLLNGEAGRR